jgi:hypothetical protein
VKGSSAAAGFQMSLSECVASEAHIAAIAAAVANISARPPRRWARATAPITAALFTTPMVRGKTAEPGRRAGSANSQ